MSTFTDSLPVAIAERITGLCRLGPGDSGAFAQLTAAASNDGRLITITATNLDFTIEGSETVTLLLHVGPPVPVTNSIDPTPVPAGVGEMDQPAQGDAA